MQRVTVPAAIAVALVLSLPSAAYAPRVHGLPNYTGPCTVDGAPGTFTGAVFVRGYTATGDDVIALLSVTGTCAAAGAEHSLNDAQSSSVVTIEKSNCSKLVLRLGTAESGDATVDLSAATMTSKANKDDRAAFCSLARELRASSSADDTAAALDEFFS